MRWIAAAGAFDFAELGSFGIKEGVRIAGDGHGAVIAIKHDLGQGLFCGTGVAAAALPGETDITAIINGATGVRCLLGVFIPIATAVVGDALRIFHLQAPAQNVEAVDAVIAEFSIAPVPEPVPVVVDEGLDVAPCFIWHGTLPKFYIDFRVRREGTFTHCLAGVVVKGAAIVNWADGTAVQCLNGGLHPGAALIAHLHEPTVFLCGGYDHLCLMRILATWLFDIDVLSGGHAEDRCGCVPKVWGGDEDSVQLFVIKEGAKVRHALARYGLLVCHHCESSFETLGIHLCQVLDLDVR